MKRLILHVATLLLAFAIGTSANALVNRAAKHFISDVVPKSDDPIVLACGKGGRVR